MANPLKERGMRRGALLACLTAALCAAAVFAGEKGVEDFLPADAIVSLCYYGDNPDVEKTALGQLAQEPEVREWWTRMRGLFSHLFRAATEELGADLDRLAPMWGCRVGGAVLPGDGNGPPQALVVAKVGGPDSVARRGVTEFLGQLKGMMGGGEPKKLQVGGIEVAQYGEGPDGLLFGFRDEYLFLGTSQAALARALAAESPKLSSVPGFRRAAAGAAGSPIALLFYNHELVMERFGGEIEREARAVLESLGLNGVRAVALRLGARERALVGTLLIHTVGERRGLVRALAAPPVDRSLLKLAPRDTSMAWAANLDPAELYEAFIGFIAAGAAAAGEDVRGDIAEFERRAGLSLSKDLFGSLGRGTVVTTSGESLLLPALIVSQAAKDGDRFEAALAKLVAQLNAAIKEDTPDGGAELRTTRYGDHVIRYLAMPGVPVPIAPCYTRVGDRIVFALTPIHLKDYLTFLDKGEPSILDNPGFQEIAKLAPPNASCVAYDNVGEQFLTLYRLFAPMLTMAQAIPGIPPGTDLANLPSARVVRRQMFGSVTYSYATDDTIVCECQSPFGVGMIAPAPAIVLLGLIGAWEERGRGEAIGPGGELMGPVAIVQHGARPTGDSRNLMDIAMGVALYRKEHGNDRFYPSSLGDLFDKKVLANEAVLVSPQDPDPPKLRNGVPCSYESVFDKYPDREFRDHFPPKQIMAWNRHPVAQGRRYVLSFDGDVELMDEAKFQQALKAVEEVVQKLPKRKAGGQL